MEEKLSRWLHTRWERIEGNLVYKGLATLGSGGVITSFWSYIWSHNQIALTASIFSASVGCLYLAFRAKKKPVFQPKLYDFFKKDATGLITINAEKAIPMNDGKPPMLLDFKIHSNFEAGSLHMSVFVPNVFTAFEGCCVLPPLYDQVLRETAKDQQDGCHRAGELSPEFLKDLIFTRKVYIYHAGGLSEEQAGEVAKLHREQNLLARFRGPKYREFRLATMPKKKSKNE